MIYRRIVIRDAGAIRQLYTVAGGRGLALGRIVIRPGRRSGICRRCGCTDRLACPGGCFWVDSRRTICSTCAGLLLVEYSE